MSEKVRIAVRWSDVDAFGHVNNAVYLHYLEEARDRLFEKMLGHDGSWDFVLAHVGIDFRSEVTQRDGEVEVECWVASIGRASVRTGEVVRKADGTVAANAESVVVPRNAETGRARPLTDKERASLQAEMDADGPRPEAE